MDKFGPHLDNTFNIEWVESSHVEFIEKDLFKTDQETIDIKDSEFLKSMEDLMTNL